MGREDLLLEQRVEQIEREFAQMYSTTIKSMLKQIHSLEDRIKELEKQNRGIHLVM